MKNLGIKARVLLLGTLPAILFAAILAGYAISNAFKVLDESLNERGRVIATQLAPAAEYGVIAGNKHALQQLVQQATSGQENVSSVLVLDTQGQILAHSGKLISLAALTKWQSNKILPLEIENCAVFIAPVYRSIVELDDINSADTQQDTHTMSHYEIGQIYVALSKQPLQTLRYQLIIKILTIAFFGLTLSALIAWQIGRNITRPIQEIANAVNKVGEGVFSQTIQENSSGELKTLQKGFNSMSSSLRQAYDHMQEKIQEATAMLRYQAEHDDLTGLTNRRQFEMRLERSLAEVKQSHAQHVLCYLDLDQFKLVNDTCGHIAGDELLKQISVLLAHRVRDKDALARVGGDEFALLLENCSLSDANRICADLIKLVRDYRFKHQEQVFNIGLSIGLVVMNDSFDNVSAIMQAADAACYSAKKSGKNQCFLYSAGDVEVLERKTAVNALADMTHNIDDRHFVLYCQPIVSLGELPETAQHYEILIRKLDANGKLIMPTSFITSAERYQLMPDIDRWVIKNTFAVYRQLLDASQERCDYIFSINLSGTSLSDKSLLGYIREQFAIYAIPPKAICFEITETAAIVNLKNTINLFTALRRIGCKFALDDFGSGMSSFMYLKNFEVDYLKIEGSFVREMHINKIDYAMVQSIHSVAEAMNIKTVAEFVETETILAGLKKIGVHYGQGHHLGMPIDVKKLVERYTSIHL